MATETSSICSEVHRDQLGVVFAKLPVGTRFFVEPGYGRINAFMALPDADISYEGIRDDLIRVAGALSSNLPSDFLPDQRDAIMDLFLEIHKPRPDMRIIREKWTFIQTDTC
jgi:hypothetical protein